MIYTDDVGRILNETLRATHGDKEKIYKKLDHYLEEKRGLLENVRIEFINIFLAALEQKIVEVKKMRTTNLLCINLNRNLNRNARKRL